MGAARAKVHVPGAAWLEIVQPASMPQACRWRPQLPSRVRCLVAGQPCAFPRPLYFAVQLLRCRALHPTACMHATVRRSAGQPPHTIPNNIWCIASGCVRTAALIEAKHVMPGAAQSCRILSTVPATLSCMLCSCRWPGSDSRAGLALSHSILHCVCASLRWSLLGRIAADNWAAMEAVSDSSQQATHAASSCRMKVLNPTDR